MADLYDFVLLDSPPMQSVTDSLTLSTLVDGTIIVVRAGETTYDMVENGLRQLKAIMRTCLGLYLMEYARMPVLRAIIMVIINTTVKTMRRNSELICNWSQVVELCVITCI